MPRQILGDAVGAVDKIYNIVNGLGSLIRGRRRVKPLLTRVALELCLGELVLGVGDLLLGGVILGELFVVELLRRVILRLTLGYAVCAGVILRLSLAELRPADVVGHDALGKLALVLGALLLVLFQLGDALVKDIDEINDIRPLISLEAEYLRDIVHA